MTSRAIRKSETWKQKKEDAFISDCMILNNFHKAYLNMLQKFKIKYNHYVIKCIIIPIFSSKMSLFFPSLNVILYSVLEAYITTATYAFSCEISNLLTKFFKKV